MVVAPGEIKNTPVRGRTRGPAVRPCPPPTPAIATATLDAVTDVETLAAVTEGGVDAGIATLDAVYRRELQSLKVVSTPDAAESDDARCYRCYDAGCNLQGRRWMLSRRRR